MGMFRMVNYSSKMEQTLTKYLFVFVASPRAVCLVIFFYIIQAQSGKRIPKWVWFDFLLYEFPLNVYFDLELSWNIYISIFGQLSTWTSGGELRILSSLQIFIFHWGG